MKQNLSKVGLFVAVVMVVVVGFIGIANADNTVTIVSDTSVDIVGIYNKATSTSTFIDLSSSPLSAVRAMEPKPYPSGYVGEDPETTDSVWDNGTSFDFEADASGADWIWETQRAEGPVRYGSSNPLYDPAAYTHGRVVVFEKKFDISGEAQSGMLYISADNAYEVWINGNFLSRSATAKIAGWETTDLHEASVASSGWGDTGQIPLDVSKLVNGENTIKILVGNEYFGEDDGNSPSPALVEEPYAQYNPGALIFKMEIEVREIEPMLTIIKEVINDDQTGSSQVSDFTLKVGETVVVSGEQNSFSAGTYLVSETGPEGYTTTYSGACDSEGSITLEANEEYICTITNDDNEPEENVCYELGEVSEGEEFASEVIDSSQGLQHNGSPVHVDRSIPEQGLVLELGQNISNFYSLGFGGWIVVKFDSPIFNGPGVDLKITEDTWGSPYPLETAEVFVSQNGIDWTLLGVADNTNLNVIHTTSEFSLPVEMEWATYVKIVDTSDPDDFAGKPTADGYDLNAVEALYSGVVVPCSYTCGEGFLYIDANGRSTESDLYWVDETTGNATFRNTYSGDYRNTLAADNDGNVFSIDRTTKKLMQLMPDGTTVEIAQTDLPKIEGTLTIAPDSTMYIALNNEKLFSVNMVTGLKTLLVDLTGDGVNVDGGDIVVNNDNIMTIINTSGKVWTVDLDNAFAVTPLGNIGTSKITGMTMLSDVYYATNDTDDKVYSFTHATVTAVEVGDFGFNFGSGDAASCNIPPEEPELATISATKIVCENEKDLPNWGSGNVMPMITSNTASRFLSLPGKESCSLERWNFEWSEDGVGNPGDNVDEGGTGWNVFSYEVSIPIGNKIWVREQMDDDYIPFTGANTTEDVSAEFYCSNDVLNYDNWEFIDPVEADETYYCVGFNTPKEQKESRKVTICHATDSESNPWRRIVVDEHAIGAHQSHGDDILLEGEQDCPIPEPKPEPRLEPRGPTGGNGPIGFGGLFGRFIPQVLGVFTGPEEKEEEDVKCGLFIKDFIKSGKNNNTSQVMLLQTFLNLELGLELSVTGFYGPETINAVRDFQLKYWEDILSPWLPFGLRSQTPTGYVYKTTLRKINSIMCSELSIPEPQLP